MIEMVQGFSPGSGYQMPVKKKLERKAAKTTEPAVKSAGSSPELLARTLDELEMSVRTANCFWDANIKTIGALIQKTESDLLALKNFNRKSLLEIKEILREMGLSLGMK